MLSDKVIEATLNYFEKIVEIYGDYIWILAEEDKDFGKGFGYAVQFYNDCTKGLNSGLSIEDIFANKQGDPVIDEVERLIHVALFVCRKNAEEECPKSFDLRIFYNSFNEVNTYSKGGNNHGRNYICSKGRHNTRIEIS